MRSDERHPVVRNLERAEDISADAMAAGIDWVWEHTLSLDFVERTLKGINYAGYIGRPHCEPGQWENALSKKKPTKKIFAKW